MTHFGLNNNTLEQNVWFNFNGNLLSAFSQHTFLPLLIIIEYGYVVVNVVVLGG